MRRKEKEKMSTQLKIKAPKSLYDLPEAAQ